MVLAITTNTPLPMLFEFTIGQLVRYVKRIDKIMPLLNPFAGLEGDKPITDPAAIRQLAKGMGI